MKKIEPNANVGNQRWEINSEECFATNEKGDRVQIMTVVRFTDKYGITTAESEHDPPDWAFEYLDELVAELNKS